MTEEEYFIKHYPDFCYYDKPLSPYWDLFQDGVEFGERQSEKKIEELEKENAELKKELKDANEKVVHLACNQNKDLKYKLTKAKEIIRELLCLFPDFQAESLGDLHILYTLAKAEQFIKEVEK